MTGRVVVFAAVATGLLVFVVPYVVSVLFGVAPNGTETLVVVIVLWITAWTVSRTKFKRDTQPR
jgi:ABC-type iron transport system FetAB permease component